MPPPDSPRRQARSLRWLCPAWDANHPDWIRLDREIAADLPLREGAVKIHLRRILAKLDLRDRVQLVVLAYEPGLIRPGSTG